MDDTKVAAVIVTFNRHDLLAKSLTSLLGQTRIPDEIFVIDNASTDGTGDLFENDAPFDLPGITYVRLEQNLGGAGGFKKGISLAYEAHYDWFWIMDDDVVCDPDCLEELLAANTYLESQKVSVSYLASLVKGSAGEAMNVPIVSKHFSDNGYPDWAEHLEQSLVRIQAATFVSLLIHRRSVEQAGLPIADFFMWGDDSEYTTRLTTYVGPAFLCGRSQVTHLRIAAQPLRTVDETDPKRIAHWRKGTRNALIVMRYYNGALKAARLVAVHTRDCLRIIAKRDKLMRKKLASIGGGVADFLLRRYDLEDLASLDCSERKNY